MTLDEFDFLRGLIELNIKHSEDEELIVEFLKEIEKIL